MYCEHEQKCGGTNIHWNDLPVGTQLVIEGVVTVSVGVATIPFGLAAKSFWAALKLLGGNFGDGILISSLWFWSPLLWCKSSIKHRFDFCYKRLAS